MTFYPVAHRDNDIQVVAIGGLGRKIGISDFSQNPVRGYARHFSVDLICAITELRMLGYPVPEEYELAVKRSIADRSLQRKKKREAKAAASNPLDDMSNGEFIFIAGYTSNGVPYGIRREETDGLDF